jgi:23S rRNA (cytidine1920-2'-O)/16S rRNA (cytidine1409-2'-O)-methyltransferase
MKKRLDLLVVERGFAETRTRAQALIMAGKVSSEGRLLDKPGVMVRDDCELHIKDVARFVSRAGEKLASVSNVLELNFNDKVILDVGASTGGFTDFVLQNGAARVYCVDVGTGQLDYKLRQDPRVHSMEKLDIRNATLPEKADMAVIDVSFISLTKILEAVVALVKPTGIIVAMAKPQFEAGRPLATKYRGVIPLGPERDSVLQTLRAWLLERFDVIGEADSGLSGAEGNVEHFFAMLSKPAESG